MKFSLSKLVILTLLCSSSLFIACDKEEVLVATPLVPGGDIISAKTSNSQTSLQMEHETKKNIIQNIR